MFTLDQRGETLELRQYKNDSIQSKKIPVLKLPRLFPRCISDEKERQFQNQIFFRLNEVVLIWSFSNIHFQQSAQGIFQSDVISKILLSFYKEYTLA